MQRLTNVVLWRGRSDPVKRLIPPHLKLAILSRGRIQVPAKQINFFLDVARSKGSSWPDRLTKGLDEIYPDYPVTFELFLNQRLSMTPDEITNALEGYLVVRRAKQKHCWMQLFAHTRGDQKKMLEREIQVDIRLLFTKPQVFIRPKTNPYQYVLLTYVCLPPEVQNYIRPQKGPILPPTPLPSPMPVLGGRLSPNTEANFRTAATRSALSLGVQAGTPSRVKVFDKREAEGQTWYELELEDPLRVVPSVGAALSNSKFLPAGTRGWMASFGLDTIVASWSLFRHDLIQYDNDHKSKSLGERITQLRQQAHKSNLPFDHVIGTKKGTLFLDQIPYVDKRWQMARDYKAFLAPDGRWVDLQHTFAGLDVLSKLERDADILGNPIGTNYAASTWGGDVGSVAGDATVRVDLDTWERWNPLANTIDKLYHYFHTRASDEDLLGDIDCWGMDWIRKTNQRMDTLDNLFASYYEDLVPGDYRILTAQRKIALERFLQHYGFTYDPVTDYPNYPVFPKQKKSAERFAKEIDLFARFWMLVRNSRLAWKPPNQRLPLYIGDATRMFLWWLEYQVIENRSTTG